MNVRIAALAAVVLLSAACAAPAGPPAVTTTVTAPAPAPVTVTPAPVTETAAPVTITSGVTPAICMTAQREGYNLMIDEAQLGQNATNLAVSMMNGQTADPASKIMELTARAKSLPAMQYKADFDACLAAGG